MLWRRRKTGEARITRGYDLPARHVIHTVGPVWHGGRQGEEEDLANCYRNSLALAVKHGLKTVAFPAISTGAYGFPPDRAAGIAVRQVRAFLHEFPELTRVTLVAFDPLTERVYRQAIKEMQEENRARPSSG